MNATEHLEVSPNHALAPALEALATLRDGWLDGAGLAPAQEPLEWLTDQLLSTFPADLPFPFACATPTGGVFLEWTKGDWIVSAEFPLPEQRGELQAVHTPTTEMTNAELALPDAGAFSAVYSFVRRFA